MEHGAARGAKPKPAKKLTKTPTIQLSDRTLRSSKDKTLHPPLDPPAKKKVDPSTKKKVDSPTKKKVDPPTEKKVIVPAPVPLFPPPKFHQPKLPEKLLTPVLEEGDPRYLQLLPGSDLESDDPLLSSEDLPEPTLGDQGTPISESDLALEPTVETLIVAVEENPEPDNMGEETNRLIQQVIDRLGAAGAVEKMNQLYAR